MTVKRGKQVHKSTTRAEMIDIVAKRTKISPSDVEKVLNAFFKATEVELSENRSVKMTGFGTFYLLKVKGRQQYSPYGDAVYTTSDHYLPKFRPSHIIEERINKKVPPDEQT